MKPERVCGQRANSTSSLEARFHNGYTVPGYPDNGAVPLRLLAFFLLASCLAFVGASAGTTAKAPVVSAGAFARAGEHSRPARGERRRHNRAE